MSKLVAKKVCLIGPFAVGKTSLVRRFVESIFSDSYLTTVGVKISKKIVTTADEQVQLMIWDIEGVDAFTALRPSNLRGAAGVLLVLDGTRPKSVEVATEILTQVRAQLPDTPVVGLINKCDREHDWKLGTIELDAIQNLGITTLNTSAKTGHNVEEAFETMVAKMGSGVSKSI